MGRGRGRGDRYRGVGIDVGTVKDTVSEEETGICDG